MAAPPEFFELTFQFLQLLHQLERMRVGKFLAHIGDIGPAQHGRTAHPFCFLLVDAQYPIAKGLEVLIDFSEVGLLFSQAVEPNFDVQDIYVLGGQ